MELGPVWFTVIGVLGLVFGSFFNVAIYRWPLEDKRAREWVVTPSRCPRCGHAIRWYDNIPLVSYLLLLRGKCRDCKTPIPWRYPLVEAGTAVLWLLTAWLVQSVGLSGVAPEAHTIWHLVFAIIFASLWLLTFIIDWETQLIPDEITVGCGVAAIAFMLVCSGATISPGWTASLIGMAALAAFYAVFALIGAMGWGDVLLALSLGILFGWPLIGAQGFLSILLGGIPAMVIMAVLIARRRYKFGETEIAFGPYIALAAYICLFWGHDLLNWYLGLFTPGRGAAG